MKYSINIILLFSVLFITSCNNKQNNNAQDTINQNETDIFDTIVVQKQDIFTVSEDLLEEYEISIKNPNTLQILSDLSLTYYPFGFFEDINSFQKQYSYLKKSEQPIEINENPQMTVYEFLYKKSYIRVCQCEEDIVADRVYEKQMCLVSSRIVDKEIQLVDSIHVDISKNNLLQKILNKKIMSMYDFSKVDTLITLSSTYDCKHIYVFINDTLKEIIIPGYDDTVSD